MKRSLCFLLTLSLIISVFSVSASALNTTDIKNSYDYNSDGKINLYDARAILKVCAGIEAPIEGKIYDLDGDGYVTFYDAKSVLSVATGISAEIDVAASQEYLLSLFNQELNRVKEVKPGFKRVTTQTTESALFTMYVSTIFGQTEFASIELSELAASSEDEEMIAMSEEVYKPKTTQRNINKNSNNHKNNFLINTGTEESSLLTVNDISSISCYEEDGYIYRTVTLGEQKYTKEQYPADLNERMKTVSYAKIFTVPQLTSSKTTLNSVTFKEGKITIKVDKYTGVPVDVRTEYRCVADLDWVLDESDSNISSGNITINIKGINMTTHVSENYTINPVEV